MSLDFDIDYFIDEIRPFFENAILKRGWSYYQDGYVTQIDAIDGTLLIAEVAGSKYYDVRIDLAHFPDSECNCPYGDYCKHMAAVLFEACERMEAAPKELLSPSTRRVVKPQDQPAFGFHGLNQGLERYNQLIPRKESPPPMLIETDTPQEWQQYFEKMFKDYPVYQVYDVERFYNHASEGLLHIALRWPAAPRALYLIHLSLFIMKQADQILRKFHGDSSNYYSHYSYIYKKTARSCLDQITEQLSDPRVKATLQHNSTHLQETIDYLAAHAFPDPRHSYMEWWRVYQLIWWNLLNKEQFIYAEQKRLKDLIHQGSSANMHEQYVRTIALLDMMAGRDHAAQQWLTEELKHVDVGHWLPYLQDFSEMKEWDRLVSWLQWIKPHIMSNNSSYAEKYLGYLRIAGYHKDLELEWVETAKAFLPSSYYSYAEYLLSEGQYREWADLCMLMNLTPQEVHSEDLKQVEKDDPRNVLPFYHHAVEEYIREKNRDAYKNAVRTMKKLFRAYKKLKQLERWEPYLAHIVKQNSRLRAFQEELRKGKLIV